MLGDVADGFLRVQRIAGGLAVVVDLLPLRAAVGGDELEIAQPAGDADADQVGGVQQLRFFPSPGAAQLVGSQVEPVGEAPVATDAVAAIEGCRRVPHHAVDR